MPETYESETEKQFPRVARDLVARWRTKEFEPYTYRLIIDDRGSRKGFPPEVLDELLMLYTMDLMINNFSPEDAILDAINPTGTGSLRR